VRSFGTNIRLAMLSYNRSDEKEDGDMKKLVLACAAALALGTTGCQAPDTHDADVKAIKDNEVQWNADWAAKDLDKLIAHYADDVFFVTAGAPAITTKDALRAAFKGMTADPVLSLKFQATRVEASKSGDAGYTMGTYTLTVTDPVSKQPVNDHGSYVTTYRKGADGSWKAVADVAVSAVPPPAPEPPPTMMKKK
jgi:uncharacterized protein (TIGR02246 family)